jgi:hypothetical protein
LDDGPHRPNGRQTRETTSAQDLFSEPDIYAIWSANDPKERDLSLEDMLSQI